VSPFAEAREFKTTALFDFFFPVLQALNGEKTKSTDKSKPERVKKPHIRSYKKDVSQNTALCNSDTETSFPISKKVTKL